jgi:hypothetical protein
MTFGLYRYVPNVAILYYADSVPGLTIASQNPTLQIDHHGFTVRFVRYGVRCYTGMSCGKPPVLSTPFREALKSA